MTWTVNIVNAQDESQNCVACKHSKKNEATEPGYIQPACCNIYAMMAQLGYLLTAIDIGADGHMAPGYAVLKCNGFELKEAQDESA